MPKKTEKLEKMTLTEFDQKYNKPNSNWRFDLFKIVCIKCNSDKVEYNGKLETEYGYYGSFDVTQMLVIKCHQCGNAFAIKNTEGGSIDYCPHDH